VFKGDISLFSLPWLGDRLTLPRSFRSSHAACRNLTDSFNIISGGTTAAAQLAIQQYLSNSPIMNATLKAPNAQLPAILSIAKAYGVTGADKVTGAGILNLDAYAAGPIQGLDSTQMMRALNGTTNLNFNTVRYSGADISHQLAAIAGFLNKSNQSDQGFTNISKMTGNIVLRNGVAQTSDLQALLDIGNLSVAGTADLTSQALNLRVTAVLTKAFTDKLGGCHRHQRFHEHRAGQHPGRAGYPGDRYRNVSESEVRAPP